MKTWTNVKDRGIVYGPDFIVNAGGVINVADELKGYDRERALEKVKTIYDQMDKVFEISKRDDITTAEAADRLAEERIDSMLNVRGNFLQNEKSSLKTV